MKPPFEIYHDKTDIADADGHICTAENPEIAQEIVASLTRGEMLADLLTALRVGEKAIDDCLNCRSHLHYKALEQVRAAIAKAEKTP